MSTIDKDSPIPLYYQLVDIILKEIEAGEFSEHSQLKTERELSEEYKVSRATVRQAIGNLERDGYIYKMQGKGTFVAPKKIEQTLEHFYSFGDEVQRIGKRPSSKVIFLEIIICSEKLSKKLGISESEKIYKLSRTRLIDNEAVIYEETYLPWSRFNNLDEQKIESSGLYNYLKNECALKIDYAVETFSATTMNEFAGKYLDDKVGAPAMKLERTTYEKEKIIEYTVSLIKANKFKFTTILKNF